MSAEIEITGGCLCGKVRYCLRHAPTEIYFCHCGQCRKAQGTAFAASLPISADDFTLTAGAEYLRAYRSSARKARYFCAHCGSPIYSQVDGTPILRIRAGSVDCAEALHGVAHIYTADKASWYRILDELPQYAAREPSRGGVNF